VRPRPRSLALILAGVLAPVTAPSRVARADEIGACKAAAEEGEARRVEGKLRAARDRFLACSRTTCPGVIRDACIQSFTEIERILPTVVVRARDARGKDVLGVRVIIDGEPVLARLTGKAIPVDPGPHRFRYEAASGQAREEQVLVAQGERDRLIHVTFDAALESDGARPHMEEAGTEPRPSLVPIGVTAGLGAAGIVAFTILHLSGWSDYDALRAQGCGVTHPCDAGGVRGKLIAADVSLGVGIASLGAALGLTIARYRSATPAPAPSAGSIAPTFAWQPSDRAGLLGLRGTF
jgi:hypothetical protein